MKIKISLKADVLYTKIEKAIESFKLLESQGLSDIDIELCVKDYIDAIFIYDQTLFESTII